MGLEQNYLYKLMNTRKNEILIALAGILGMSENPFDDIKLLSQHPGKYVAQGLHKRPTLHSLTESVIPQLIRHDPSTYFYYKLHKDPSFAKYNIAAAKSLIEKDPLSAVLLYKLQRNTEFDSLMKELLSNLLDYLTNNGFTIEKNSAISKEIKIMYRIIEKSDPEFYKKHDLDESQLSELKQEEHGTSTWEPEQKTEIGEAKWNEPTIEVEESDVPEKPLSKRHKKIDFI